MCSELTPLGKNTYVQQDLKMISGVNSIQFLNIRKKLKRVFRCDSAAAKRRGRRKARCLQSLKHIAWLTLKIKSCTKDTHRYLCSLLSKNSMYKYFI